jgi:glycosyl hydrolase family 64 (putative beta-1,3-glucanase)
MPIKRTLLSVAIALLGAVYCPHARADLSVKVVNKSGVDPSHIFIMFGAAPLQARATINGAPNTPIARGVSYGLATIKDIKITSFPAGKIYVSLKGPLNSEFPNFNNPSLSDYNLRWDKVEITVIPGNPSSCANLSAQDFFSVPLRIDTFKADNSPASTLSWRTPTATVFSPLGALSNYHSSAVATGNNGVPTDHGTILRIISPATVPDPSAYQSWDTYIKYVQTNNIVTPIAGEFMGGNHPRFDLSAHVDPAGTLVMTGTAAGNPANIQIAAGNLSKGIWSCNPDYIVNGAVKHMGDNDVYSAAVRDVLAGFNYGFIGSPETNPNTAKPFGAGPSENWYRPKAPPQSLAFEAAQPGHDGFYNRYASYLAKVSDAYSFPFTDVCQAPQASLDPASIASMTITVQADN